MHNQIPIKGKCGVCAPLTAEHTKMPMRIDDPAVKMILQSTVLDPRRILACTRLAVGVDRRGSQKVLFTTGHILPRHKLFYRLSRGAAFISTGNISLSFSLNRIKNICRSLLKFNKSLYQFRLKKL